MSVVMLEQDRLRESFLCKTNAGAKKHKNRLWSLPIGKEKTLIVGRIKYKYDRDDLLSP